MEQECLLDRIAVPDGYDVLDATALRQRLGLKRDTVLAYLSRRNFGRIPKPNRKLAISSILHSTYAATLVVSISLLLMGRAPECC